LEFLWLWATQRLASPLDQLGFGVPAFIGLEPADVFEVHDVRAMNT
jgi:hypothetical protein